MVKTYKDLMTRAGITANVTFRDVSANDRARFGTNISAQATGPATSSARCSRCRARTRGTR